MTKLKYFSDVECEMCLPWMELTNRLEAAMKQFSNGEVTQPVRTTLKINEADGTSFLMMPCYSPADKIITCKLICMYPQNQKRFGLSTHIVYIVVFDAVSGELISLMDAEGVTKRRTSAASALSARWLAHKEPNILSICGSGHQAYSHLQVLLNQYRQSLKEIRIWNHRKTGAQKLSAEVSGWIGDDITLKVCDDVATCVKNADIVVTATFSPDPYLKKEMIQNGTHIMSVGAVGSTLSELHPNLMNSSEVYVDSYAGASVESGDIIRSNCSIKAELGEVIAGEKAGRENKDSITIYKSLGLAVQDLAAAKLISDISDSSNTEIPIPQVKAKDIKISKHIENVDTKNVTTTCQSETLTFTAASRYNETFNYVSCEIALVKSVDGSVGSSVCFLYNAVNGKLVAFIPDWNSNASDDTKRELLSSLSKETIHEKQ